MVDRGIRLGLFLALSSALVACGGGGGGGGGGGSSTITVSGTVIDGTGALMSGVNVILNGDAASLVTTGADGKFSFSKVARPYALTLGSGSSVVEYHGLRRAAPQLAFQSGGLIRSVHLSGTVTGPTFPLPSGQGILLGASNGVLTSGTASSTTGAYTNQSFVWSGKSTSVTTSVAALHVAADLSGITDYLHVGSRPGVVLADGVSQTGLDFAASGAVPTGTTVFDYSLGAYTSGTPRAGYWLLSAGGAQFFLGSIPWVIATGSTLKLPSEGASLVVAGDDADGNSAYRFGTAHLGGTTTLDLPATTALKNSLPADLATGVSKTPILSWAPVSGATLYLVTVSGPTDYSFFLPGDASTFTVPDYTVLSLALAGSTSYDWSVVAVSSADFTPDALVDPASSGFSELSLYSIADLSFYTSYSTSFTTAP
jgi:hypothetical protein